MSDLLIWKNKKSLWTKVGKAGSVAIQVMPATKTQPAILTNGHFAVAVGRALVKDCEAQAGITFEKMSGRARRTLPRKLAKTKARTFQRTPVLTQAGKELYRVYRDTDSGAMALYSALYVEFLGEPETVYAVGVDAVAVDDPAEASLWLMPRRMSDAEKAILSPNGSTPTPAPAPAPKPAPKPVPKPEPAPAPVMGDAAAVAVGAEVHQSGTWLWAKFPARPSAEIREQMRSAGWHWSRRRQEWYLRPAKVAA